MEEFIHFNLFYILLFVFLIITIIAVCSTIKNKNGHSTFRDIFFKSSDNAKEVTIDTTTKMGKMHDNVVHLQFGIEHEQELDSLEKNLKKLDEDVQELKETVTLLFNKVIELEKQHKQ